MATRPIVPDFDQVHTPVPTTSDPENFDANADALFGGLPADVASWNLAVAAMNSLGSYLDTLAAGVEAAIAGGALALDYKFSTTTTDADPGPGFVRFNNATQSAATSLFIDLVDRNGVDQTAALDLLDDSTSAIKGFLRFTKTGDGSKVMVFAVTGMTTVAGYRKVLGSFVVFTSASPFANLDNVTTDFTRTGDKGDTGPTGPAGPPNGTATGAVDFLTGASIAGTASPNFNTRTGDRLHITGSGWNITSPVLTRGPVTVIFDGVGTLTHNATTNNLPGAQNIATQAGDRAVYFSDGTTVYLGFYMRQDGTAIVGGAPALGAPGTAVVANSAATGDWSAVTALSATRSIGIYRNGSSYPVAIVRDANGATISTLQIEAKAVGVNCYPVIKTVPGSTTQAVAVWANVTDSNTRLALLTDNGASITATALAAMPSIGASAQVGLAMHSATKAAAFASNAGAGWTLYSVVAVAAGSLTPGAYGQFGSLSDANANATLRAAEFSPTQGVLIVSANTNTITAAYPYTEAAGVITAGVGNNLVIGNSTGVSHGDAVNLTATRVFAAANAGGNGGPANAMTLDISGTGSTATLVVNSPELLPPSTGPVRVSKVSGTAAVVAMKGQANNARFLQALKISGALVQRGGGAGLGNASNLMDVCVCGANAVVAYGDAENSNYPTARPVSLGTVV